MSLKAYLTLETCILVILLFTSMLTVSWGYVRHKTETENVQLTQVRIDTVVRACAQLDRPPALLRDLLDKKLAGAEILMDAWGRDLQFDPKRGVVYSLGADGLPGGTGYAADLEQSLPKR